MFTYILPTTCFLNNEQTVVDNMSKPLDMVNPFETKLEKNDIKDELDFKPFLTNIEKNPVFPSKQYFEKENIFNPFEGFNLNRNMNNSPKIIITRFSRPPIRREIRENDSLDLDSSIITLKPSIDKFHRHKNHINRRFRSSQMASRHQSKKRNRLNKKQAPGFMSVCLDYIKSISLIRILMYILFTMLFIFVGYHLRKNEEESNYVGLAPQ